MANENTFERLSLDITDASEGFILFALRRLRIVQNKLINDPALDINERRELERLQNEWADYIRQAEAWTDKELAESYLRGIKQAGTGAATGVFATSGLLIPSNPSQPISDTAQEILKDFPNHHTMYGVFKQAADNQLEATRLPIVRQHQDRLREMIVQASDESYRTADTLTRRDLSQSLMKRFSDEGITGIRYSNGRTVNLDSYSELVARTQTKNAFNQANWNRLQEQGNDLTLISTHYPTSPMCEPWQGGVYSISGNDNRYTALETAIRGGLFHVNCKHTSSGYSEGQPLPDQETTKTRNKEMYDAQMKQRYNERQIKAWKRREATAVTPDARQKAKSKIRSWQKRQRDLIDNNKFLKRKYDREQI